MQGEKDTRLFGAIDADKTGSIKLAELRAFMRREDPSLTDAQVQELFDRLDQNRDGSVTKKEFLGTQFTRFTGTKVQILTQKGAFRALPHDTCAKAAGQEGRDVI